jgi:16S rRNA (uracil1498-N3)-methyltransferase
MSERFFVEDPISDQVATLSGGEAHHFSHALRGKVGDVVTLFNGGGEEFTGQVLKVSRGQVELAILERRAISRELPFVLCVGVALPKGDRQKWLVEKLTELGVTKFIPLETQRGVAQPTASAMSRLERWVVEVSKQCGRNVLMSIEPAQSLQAFSDSSSAVGSQCLFADTQATTSLSITAPSPGQYVYLAIGPEGGWTDAERITAREGGWQCVSLGDRVLRVETAAIALAAWVSLACRR